MSISRSVRSPIDPTFLKFKKLLPYAFTLAAIALMATLRYLLDPLLGDHHHFGAFFIAIFVSSWYFGWKAGALALGLGLLADDYLFIEPRGSFGGMNFDHRVGMLVHSIVAVVNIFLIELLRRTKHRSEFQFQTLREEITEHRLTQEALRRAHTELEQRVDLRTAELAKTAGNLEQETTARQDAEARVQRLAALVASSDDAIIGITSDGQITDWNVGAEQLFNYAAGEVIGKSALMLVAPEEREKSLRTLESLRLGGAIEPYEAIRLRKGNEGVPVSVRLSPIRSNGHILGFSLIYRDLTGAKRLEEQLRQSQKMEAIGQLAGGIAHDFNNLLTVICGYSEILLGMRHGDSSVPTLIREIQESGQRAATLTRQLLAFSRKQVLEPKILDLNETVKSSERMLSRLIGEDIQLATALHSDLRSIKVDPGQIDQVIMNLAVNARDAMPQGGKLTIETSNVDLDESFVSTRQDLLPGHYVLLAVSDTGTGMDAATRARIFDPFFTTKELGKGTGLGLSVVHGIVRQSGGHIAVYSEKGHGTTFKVYLPAVDFAEPSGKSHPGIAPGSPKGSETILLVEDEESVRGLACRSLRKLGYTVLESAHGREALRVAEEHSDPIHMLVSDVVMPEVGGRILAEGIEDLRPGIKVLFMSGYTDDAVVRHGILEAEVAFLQKPFTPANLAKKVREVLDR